MNGEMDICDDRAPGGRNRRADDVIAVQSSAVRAGSPVGGQLRLHRA